jgi:hypothetical protein
MKEIKTTAERSALVNSVMFALHYHKPEIAEMLFPGAADAYKLECSFRDPFNFWLNLDLKNRERVVQWASDFYADS